MTDSLRVYQARGRVSLVSPNRRLSYLIGMRAPGRLPYTTISPGTQLAL